MSPDKRIGAPNVTETGPGLGHFQLVCSTRSAPSIRTGMIGNPRYGRIGLVALPYYLFFELLAPFVELIALVAVPAGLLLGAVDLDFL